MLSKGDEEAKKVLVREENIIEKQLNTKRSKCFSSDASLFVNKRVSDYKRLSRGPVHAELRTSRAEGKGGEEGKKGLRKKSIGRTQDKIVRVSR